jgi:osmoprotectant transport system permease protein
VGPEDSVTPLAAVTIRAVFNWFDDRHHWSGYNGIPTRLAQHLSICAVSLLVACAIALPVGVALGHWRRGGLIAQNVANLGRAIPSLAILIIAVPIVGIGPRPAEVAMIALAIPPLLTNTYVGMVSVDDDIRDAARGLGMNAWQAVWRAELPNALPLILAGLNTASFQVIATATLAAEVASGGLGQFITQGLAVRDDVQVVCGSLLVVGLAVGVEILIAGLQRLVVPAPLRNPTRYTTDPQLEESTDGNVLDLAT